MTKILHFNLSGNHLFEGEEPDIIIKDLGRCMETETEEQEEKAEEYFYKHMTTLRDISVLLHIACG